MNLGVINHFIANCYVSEVYTFLLGKGKRGKGFNLRKGGQNMFFRLRLLIFFSSGSGSWYFFSSGS